MLIHGKDLGPHFWHLEHCSHVGTSCLPFLGLAR